MEARITYNKSPRYFCTVEVKVWNNRKCAWEWQTVESTDRQGDAMLLRDWLRMRNYDTVEQIYESDMYWRLFG